MNISRYYMWLMKDISWKRRLRVAQWLLQNHNLHGPFPLYSKIEITQHCNLKCPKCFRTHEKIPLGRELSLEQFKYIIDRLGPGMTEVWTHGFGEPLMHKDFLEMMTYVRSKGMTWGVATNGTRFHRHDIRRMMTLQPTNIRFSIDAADPERFHELRYPAELENLKEAFLELKAVRDELHPKRRKLGYIRCRPLLSIYSVIDLTTIDQIPKLVELTKEWGADYISFSDITWNNQFGTSHYDNAIASLPWWEIMKIRAPYELDKTVKFSFPPFIIRPCAYPKMHVYIDALGDIYPCTCVPGLEPSAVVPFANIFKIEGDMRDVYKSKAWNRFRDLSCRGALPNQSCRQCRQWGPDHSAV